MKSDEHFDEEVFIRSLWNDKGKFEPEAMLKDELDKINKVHKPNIMKKKKKTKNTIKSS